MQPYSPIVSLDSLPNEVITTICDYLGKEEIINLRLVNVRISTFATTSLAKNYMSNVRVFLTRPGLETLDRICAHPVFAPQVRRLHFPTGRLAPDFIKQRSKEYSRISEDENRTPEQVKLARQNLHECQQRMVEEYNLEKSGDAVRLLTSAFRSLKNYHNTQVVVSMTEEFWPGFEEYLAINSDGHGDARAETPSDEYLKSTIEPCIAAMVRAGLCFSGLNLIVGNFKDASNTDEKNWTTNADDDFNIFSGLKSVQFDASTTFPQVSIQSLVRIIFNASHLEELTFMQMDGTNHRLGDDHFDACSSLIRAIQSDRLHYLEFEFVSFTHQELIDLLSRHSTTLRTLHIRDCSLRKGIWKEVLLWIKKNLYHLDHLGVADLHNAVFDRGETTHVYRRTPYGPLLNGAECHLDSPNMGVQISEFVVEWEPKI